MDTVKDPQIIAVVCKLDGEIHITNVNSPLSQVNHKDGYLTINNIIFPFEWYDWMELCDEKNFRERYNDKQNLHISPIFS
jgi:hypothetical protein